MTSHDKSQPLPVREEIARLLCDQRGYNPDALEPGDVYGIDGYCSNGDPAHFMWRQFADDADAVLAALSRQSDDLVTALEEIKSLKSEPIGDTGFSVGPLSLFNAAQRIARDAIKAHRAALRSRATSTEKKERAL